MHKLLCAISWEVVLFKSYKACMQKYAVFSGRATRAEYWWFFLANILVSLMLVFAGFTFEGFVFLANAYFLITLIPGAAVFWRRLHDTNRSGYNFLWALLPVIGWLVLIVYMCLPSATGENKYDEENKEPHYMTKAQFFSLLKAPFNQGFVGIYLLSLVVLLAVPFCAKALYVLSANIEEFSGLPKVLFFTVYQQKLFEHVSIVDLSCFYFSVSALFVFLWAYTFALTHRAACDKRDVFEFSNIFVRLKKVFPAILQLLGLGLIVFLVYVLVSFVLVLSIFAFFALSLFFSFLTIPLLIALFIYLFYKAYTWFFAGLILFFKEYRLSVFFDRERIKVYFKTNKRYVLIYFLLISVLFQLFTLICVFLGVHIFKLEVILGAFIQSNYILHYFSVFVGFLLANFVLTYLFILKGIIHGKIVSWVYGKSIVAEIDRG